MLNNSEYWQGRYEMLELARHQNADEVNQQLIKILELSKIRIKKEINAFFMRLSANNSISIAEAEKLLTDGELEEFKWTLEDYMYRVENINLNPAWFKQLENASLRVRITRLDELALNIQQCIEEMTTQEINTLNVGVEDSYKAGYYKSIYEIQTGTSTAFMVGAIDSEQLRDIVRKPWTTDSKTFSDRLWNNKEELLNDLQTNITSNIALGRPPDETVKVILQYVDEQFDNAKYIAFRLAQTETANANILGMLESFKETGVEEYKICATFDTKTSEICRSFDGKVFKTIEAKIGTNCPVFHPNCRTTIVPYFGYDWGTKIARLKNGKTHSIPKNMSYDEWYAEYIEGAA